MDEESGFLYALMFLAGSGVGPVLSVSVTQRWSWRGDHEVWVELGRPEGALNHMSSARLWSHGDKKVADGVCRRLRERFAC